MIQIKTDKIGKQQIIGSNELHNLRELISKLFHRLTIR